MKITNAKYTGANDRQSLIDLEIPEDRKVKDLVFFVHGYKGYKDWGCWNMVQDYFVSKGIGFAKLNLSHNGGTVDDPIDFPDLEAFGQNRYTYEITDIKNAIDWLGQKVDLNTVRLHLLGHSRGGADVILSGMDPRVTAVLTWASIADIPSRFPKDRELDLWYELGVRYVKNGRTKQEMPHYISFYEDWKNNQERLSIEKNAKALKEAYKPCLHIHGSEDEAVSSKHSDQLSSWTNGELIVINNTGHTFGSKHPWDETILPSKLKEACLLTIQFLRELDKP